MKHSMWVAVALGLGMSGTAWGQLAVDKLPVDLKAKVDAVAEQVLAQTGVPSASVAIVRNGAIVYTQAYGDARLAAGSEPAERATPEMRYSIGSISKQFTAAAILLLEQEGKLSIDDPVGRYLPELTRAKEVTIREVLSHTSGYEDYWPEDYLMPPMQKPTTAGHILEVWGKKPLDFDPGTKWQYSNTGYVIAGRIAEMASGEPLMQFLQEHVFGPLGMKEVWDSDTTPLPRADAEGYSRYALGPLRPGPEEGAGWMSAAGELAMPAYDLAQWDISLMKRNLLAKKSYDEMFAPVKLKDGSDSHYGLGIHMRDLDGHVLYEHSGEVEGFTAENYVFPNDKAAIAVLTNQDAARGAALLARALAPLVVGGTMEGQNPAEVQARQLLEQFQQGKIDRSSFTPWCNAYFDEQALRDYETSLAPLGEPVSVTETAESLRGGMTFRYFQVIFAGGTQVHVTTYTMPDGKLEQYLVEE